MMEHIIYIKGDIKSNKTKKTTLMTDAINLD